MYGIKITAKSFKEIVTLVEEQYIKKSLFSNKKLLNFFISSNVVRLGVEKPIIVYLNSSSSLLGSLTHLGYKVDSVKDLSRFTTLKEGIMSRDEVTDFYSDTKAAESKSFNGVTISSFTTIDIILNGIQQKFHPPLPGTGVFIHYSQKVEFPLDVVVVGVENPQVVWYIQRYKHLFAHQNIVFLATSDYKTTYPLEWLKTMPNKYIHFGDFDLAGISIYLHTIVPRLLMCASHSYFIPDDTPELIKQYGNSKLFTKQIRFINISSSDKSISSLIELLIDAQKAFEQENLALL